MIQLNKHVSTEKILTVGLIIILLFIIYVTKNQTNETFGSIKNDNLCIVNSNCMSENCVIHKGKNYGFCK